MSNAAVHAANDDHVSPSGPDIIGCVDQRLRIPLRINAWAV
jgi:hypothetical protein